jgi:uncharacterized protein YfeS
VTKQDAQKWDQLDLDWTEFHPNARSILDDPFFWDLVDHYSPNGSDGGYDVFMGYKQWRIQNPPGKEKEFLDNLIKGWGFNEISCNDEAAHGMLDNALIALAFAAIKFDGTCSEWSAKSALQAIARRRQFPSDYRHEIFDKIKNKLLMFAPDYKDLEPVIHAEEDEEPDEIIEQQNNQKQHRQDTASKAKVLLKNIDPDGPVYVDARLSKGGEPFDSLMPVPGFPRWICHNETVEIEMGNYPEILYKRATNKFDQQLSPDQLEFMWIYRIGNPRGVVISAFLNKHVRRSLQEIESIREFDKTYGKSYDDRNRLDEKWAARLRYESSNYVVEPFARKILLNRFLIFLRVVNKKSGKTAQRMILESYHDEAIVLFKKIELKKGMINVVLDPMHYASYAARGFPFNMQVPLALILDGDP